MRRSKLILLVLVLALATLPATSSLARPQACNFTCLPGVYPGSPCVCPSNTLRAGAVLTCDYYWSGYCNAYFAAPASAAASAATIDELSALLAAAPAPEPPATKADARDVAPVSAG